MSSVTVEQLNLDYRAILVGRQLPASEINHLVATESRDNKVATIKQDSDAKGRRLFLRLACLLVDKSNEFLRKEFKDIYNTMWAQSGNDADKWNDATSGKIVMDYEFEQGHVCIGKKLKHNAAPFQLPGYRTTTAGLSNHGFVYFSQQGRLKVRQPHGPVFDYTCSCANSNYHQCMDMFDSQLTHVASGDVDS